MLGVDRTSQESADMSCYDIFCMKTFVNFIAGNVEGSRTILGLYSVVCISLWSTQTDLQQKLYDMSSYDDIKRFTFEFSEGFGVEREGLLEVRGRSE
jgi:hypothetical protein